MSYRYARRARPAAQVVANSQSVGPRGERVETMRPPARAVRVLPAPGIFACREDPGAAVREPAGRVAAWVSPAASGAVEPVRQRGAQPMLTQQAERPPRGRVPRARQRGREEERPRNPAVPEHVRDQIALEPECLVSALPVEDHLDPFLCRSL